MSEEEYFRVSVCAETFIAEQMVPAPPVMMPARVPVRGSLSVYAA